METTMCCRVRDAALSVLFIFLTHVYHTRSDDKYGNFHLNVDKRIHELRSVEDKAFSDSGVCRSENRSYVETCNSEKTADTLHALTRAQCFCDENCHKYDDCCMNVHSRDYDTLPWRCRDVRGRGDTRVPIYVLQKCPERWEDARIRAMCEEEAGDLQKKGGSFSYLQDIPVKSKTSDLFYRNVYCALCNRESELEEWNSTLFCAGISHAIYNGMEESKFDFSRSFYDTRTQRFHNVIADGRRVSCRLIIKDFRVRTITHVHQARLCKPFINTCDGDADAKSWQKCKSYTSFVYANGYPNSNRRVYKNFHCALCNKVDSAKLRCTDPLKPPILSDPNLNSGAVLNFLFDFNFEGGSNQIGITSNCRISEGLIWDSLLKKCQNFTCGSLFVRQGSECVPRITEDSYGGLNDSCLKIILSRSEFILQKNRSVLVKRSNKMLHVSEYEIHEKDGLEVLSINVCVEDGSYLLNLSRVHYWLSEITLSLSIICLIIHLFVYSVLKDLRNCPGKILMSLSTCLVCGHICLLIGQHFAELYTLCYASGVLMHFGYLSSFLWMNVMAYDIYRTFSLTQSRNSKSKKTFLKYSLYCWITAASITSFSVLFDNFISPENEYRPKYGDPICWFNQRKGLVIFFILPILNLLVMNMTFFVITAFRIRTISKETKMVKNFSDKVRYLLYIKLTVVLGITWLLGILAGLLRVSFLWYPFILLNGLQGVFIFVAFTIKRKIIRRLLVKFKIHSDSYKMGKQSAIRKALYSSLSNLSSLQTTVISQLPSGKESQEILRAVRKINPDTVI